MHNRLRKCRPGRGIAENVPNEDIKKVAMMIRDQAPPFAPQDFAMRLQAKGIPATEETIRAAQNTAVETLAYLAANTK